MGKAKTDKEFLERLRKEAPEVLEAEVDFDEHVMRALKANFKPARRAKSTKHKVSQAGSQRNKTRKPLKIES